jgi:hypothetical protein
MNPLTVMLDSIRSGVTRLCVARRLALRAWREWAAGKEVWWRIDHRANRGQSGGDNNPGDEHGETANYQQRKTNDDGVLAEKAVRGFGAVKGEW